MFDFLLDEWIEIKYIMLFFKSKALMNRFRYLILSAFISLCAFAFTRIIFSVTHDAWMAVFYTASTTIFFILENIELEKLLKARDAEIQALKSTAQVTLMCRTNELENEIHRLLKPHVCWRDGWKSCSSLQ